MYMVVQVLCEERNKCEFILGDLAVCEVMRLCWKSWLDYLVSQGSGKGPQFHFDINTWVLLKGDLCFDLFSTPKISLNKVLQCMCVLSQLYLFIMLFRVNCTHWKQARAVLNSIVVTCDRTALFGYTSCTLKGNLHWSSTWWDCSFLFTATCFQLQD